jgi:hypothetical protein
MRRIALFSLLAAAVAAVPAAAVASRDTANDGVLVVKNGQAPYFPLNIAKSTPVIVLRNFAGTVIGQTTDQSRIVIDSGPKGVPAEVTGAGASSSVPQSDTAQAWSSVNGFKFRAVDGKFTILVYGSGVNLVAIGTGIVTLAGMPDTPVRDGRYSVNGGEFVSMPGQPLKQLISGDS